MPLMNPEEFKEVMIRECPLITEAGWKPYSTSTDEGNNPVLDLRFHADDSLQFNDGKLTEISAFDITKNAYLGCLGCVHNIINHGSHLAVEASSGTKIARLQITDYTKT